VHDKAPLRLTVGDLETRVQSVVPHAHLVSEHIVRKAAREEHKITGVRTFVPHTHALAVPTDALTRALPSDERAELGELHERDGWTILLPKGEDVVEGRDALDVLVDTWRRLFHARIDEELGRQVASGALGRARVLETIDRIGQLPMDEARAVLADEGLTSPESDPARELIELVALYGELRFFAPDLISHFFPSLVGRDEIIGIFDAIVPAATLFAETRLASTPDPIAHRAEAHAAHEEEDVILPGWRVRNLLEAARQSRKRARDSDAAQSAWRARQIAPRDSAEHREATELEAVALASLGQRLARLAGTDDQAEWSSAAAALLPRARRGMTSVEGRLLHDLQKACDDSEGEDTSVDVWRWLRRFGREPLRRHERVLQEVTVARHVASALRRVPLVTVLEAERRRMKRLLGELAAKTEERLRASLGETIERGLRDAGLVPANVPEQVGEHKLAAELCDKVLDKGFITFADVRDLIARNQLKLPDLEGPLQVVVRDQLLRFDRFLRTHLDGAYRPGEAYRRGLQKLSSVLFANSWGRVLVRYAILPFGGSFMLIQGFDHVVLAILGAIFGFHAELWSIPLWITLGVLLFGILHFPRFKRGALATVRGVGHGARFVAFDVPRAVSALPAVQRFVATPGWRFVHDTLWRPLWLAALPTSIIVWLTREPQLWLWIGVPLWIGLSLFLSTRLGGRLVERTRESVVFGWRQLLSDWLPRLFSAIMGFFKSVVERAEVVLYTVDKWLRFRRGDSLVGVVLKSAFLMLWSIVAYVVRLVVNLVAEPQLNPIKHFPVVTVSHKFTIGWSLALMQELRPSIGEPMAGVIALMVQLVIPGLAGFLVWEFKENWRLYQQNRKPVLAPVIVGSHGEPVGRLIRPGFHSGTVPTLFKKLRRAERKGKPIVARGLHEDLHHVEQAVERFVARELKALLELSGQLPAARTLHVQHVQLTPARIAIELGCPELGPEPMRLAFEEQGRFVVADVVQRGFLTSFGDDPMQPARVAFATALLGLYKLAGVQLVRGHIVAALPPDARYDITARGLVVWLGAYTTEVVYPWVFDASELVPTKQGRVVAGMPKIPVDAVAFQRRVVTWAAWTEAWQSPEATAALRERVMGEQLLLS